MKHGIRKPSLKKIVSARSTSSTKRAIKKSVIPGYSCRGIGCIKNPSNSAYNKVYNTTTFSILDIFKFL